MKLIDMPLSYAGKDVAISDGDTTISGVLTSVGLAVDSIFRWHQGHNYRMGRIEVSLDDGRLKANLPHNATVILKGISDDNS